MYKSNNNSVYMELEDILFIMRNTIMQKYN